jgi:hypothetical protein
MGIQESQLAPLRAFGYTEAEARFLYLVATHSGYFTVRQFLEFAKAKSGKRNARLVEKLFALGHVSAQRYRRRSLVYHLHSRPIYDAIGKGDRRNRRGHEIKMTADIYTHTSAEAERDAAIALERAIYGDLFPVVPNIENRNNFAAPN